MEGRTETQKLGESHIAQGRRGTAGATMGRRIRAPPHGRHSPVATKQSTEGVGPGLNGPDSMVTCSFDDKREWFPTSLCGDTYVQEKFPDSFPAGTDGSVDGIP